MIIGYFAKIRPVDNGFVITFPDVPGCFTCAFTRDEIEPLAREVLSFAFHGHVPEDLPAASAHDALELEEGQEALFVEAEMALENGRLRSLIDNGLL